MPGDMRLGGGKAPKGGRGTHGQECGEEGEVVSGASEADLFAGDSERGRDQKDAKVQTAERTLLKQAHFKFNIMCWLAPFGRWFAQASSLLPDKARLSTMYRATILDGKTSC